LGPPIAIGAPGEVLALMGAYRGKFGDDEWQSAIVSWMKRVHLFVVIASTTRWLKWGIMQVVARQFISKCIVLCGARDGARRACVGRAVRRDLTKGRPSG
jgi:hypothetical protein